MFKDVTQYGEIHHPIKRQTLVIRKVFIVLSNVQVLRVDGAYIILFY